MAFHPEWQGNKMTNPKTDNHCILAGNCLELSLIINVTESSNAAMISRKDSRDQRFRQSGADMLLTIDSTMRGTNHAKKLRGITIH